MTHTVTVEHTFETGHRLPHLNGKCESLHGHSWRVQVTIAGARTQPSGILIEFAALKKHLRTWVDEHLDHGLMLGAADPLAALLSPWGKVFVFGVDAPSGTMMWPTVENVAVLLSRVMQDHLNTTGENANCYVNRVDVHETSVNCASWTAE